MADTFTNCPDCDNGQVEERCGKCRGRGEEVHELCDGKGYTYESSYARYDDFEARREDCRRCSGTGWVRCSECAGRGYFKERCSTCKGVGQLDTDVVERIVRERQERQRRHAEEQKIQAAEAAKRWAEEEPMRRAAEEEQKRQAEAYRQQQENLRVQALEEAKRKQEATRQILERDERSRRHQCMICGKTYGISNEPGEQPVSWSMTHITLGIDGGDSHENIKSHAKCKDNPFVREGGDDKDEFSRQVLARDNRKKRNVCMVCGRPYNILSRMVKYRVNFPGHAWDRFEQHEDIYCHKNCEGKSFQW